MVTKPIISYISCKFKQFLGCTAVKLGILVGTRPEVIKMAPIIRKVQELKDVELTLIHSNQHYSESMDAVFFEELELPKPHFNLNVGIESGFNQIGNIMIKLEPIIKDQKLDVLLVQGDTNTVAAGALVASKLGVKVGHVEAGLRSYDKSMPEEGNRIVTDHLAEYLFAVTDTQVNILKGEGIPKNKIFKVGNTIVDSVLENKDIALAKSKILAQLSLEKKNYTLFTAHRAGNVDKVEALKQTLDILREIPGKVCWPVHLRTKNNIEKFKLEVPSNVIQCEPLSYFDFLTLEANARLIVTDSGGLQEEACILGVPCITIRENTERPETIEVGANTLVGRDLKRFQKALGELNSEWSNPFGDGDSSVKIINTILDDFGLAPITIPSKRDERIVVVGLGYMGIPTATLLANHGYKVTGVDLNQEKVEALNRGKLPFSEIGMDELLKKALSEERFLATSKPVSGDIFLVAVPTPHIGKKCDLSYVISAVESLLPVLENGNILIIESTIKPGTCDRILAPILKNAGLEVDIVHCPERAIPGNTLYELAHNDRIIGSNSKRAQEITERLYRSFVKGEIFKTSAVNAECSKLLENTFRDVNIALANEFSVISDDLGCDSAEVIRLANRHPRVNVHSPGPGVGGHCIPIDPWFLTEDTEKAELISLARVVNDRKPIWSIEKFLSDEKVGKDEKIVLLGVAYKPNIDDARETPAATIFKHLAEKGLDVRCCDPLVNDWEENNYTWEEVSGWGDRFVVVTRHDIFQENKYKKKQPYYLK